jgi:hypothetical protein
MARVFRACSIYETDLFAVLSFISVWASLLHSSWRSKVKHAGFRSGQKKYEPLSMAEVRLNLKHTWILRGLGSQQGSMIESSVVCSVLLGSPAQQCRLSWLYIDQLVYAIFSKRIVG